MGIDPYMKESIGKAVSRIHYSAWVVFKVGGLRAVEGRFGMSSKEAQQIREFIQAVEL